HKLDPVGADAFFRRSASPSLYDLGPLARDEPRSTRGHSFLLSSLGEPSWPDQGRFAPALPRWRAIHSPAVDVISWANYSSAEFYRLRQSPLWEQRWRSSYVPTVRADRQDCPGRSSGEPLEHQDEAAISAQSAQCHPDVGRAGPLRQ